MTMALMFTVIPAALAAAFDSVAFALLAGAGLLWVAAIAVCSTAPVVAGRSHTINESVASTLSIFAAGIAIIGLAVFLVL